MRRGGVNDDKTFFLHIFGLSPIDAKHAQILHLLISYAECLSVTFYMAEISLSGDRSLHAHACECVYTCTVMMVKMSDSERGLVRSGINGLQFWFAGGGGCTAETGKDMSKMFRRQCFTDASSHTTQTTQSKVH